MHYASCCQLQGNGAVLHEYMGVYWKMMDDFASFLKIMIFFKLEKNKTDPDVRRENVMIRRQK